jgi:hypothetical protein
MMYDRSEIEELAPWMAVIFTLIGGALRIFLLSNKGLWLDEAFSTWLSSHNVTDMLYWIVQIDQHPPLYYFLLHYWTSLNGNSPYDLRLLSAILGTATIPIVYLTGKRLCGWAVGLVAALILALSPFNIRYAQEARMYTLLMFNASVAFYALVRLLTDPRSTQPIGSQFRHYLRTWRNQEAVEPGVEKDFSYRDLYRRRSPFRSWASRHRWLPIQAIETDLAWVGLIVFSAATMLSHNTGVLFPLAANIFFLGFMLFRRSKKSNSEASLQPPSFSNWVKAQVGIFVLWSPWIYGFIRQTNRVFQEFWIAKPGLNTVIQFFETFLNETVPGRTSQMNYIWILYAVLFGFGLLYYRKQISHFFLLAALFAVPILGELVVSLWRPVFLDRTLIWTSISLFMLLAIGVTRLRFPLLIVVVVGVLGTINLFSVGDYYHFAQKEDWSDPAGFVANFAKKDDLVLFNITSGQIPFDYYFQPFVEKYHLQVEKHGVPVDMFDSGVLEPKMTESDVPRLLSLMSGPKQVWLVYSRNTTTDPLGLIPQTLGSQMQLIYTRDYLGVQLQWYIAPSG